MLAKNKPYRIALVAIVVSLSLGCSCFAFQQSPVVELEPVVVTASAVPHRLDETPETVTILSREEIDRQQANRVAEILRHVPGLHVDEMGGRGGISSVYIRGGDPNFTTVMIDGIQINDPTNPRGGSADLSSLTPEQIDRIEVVRGPMSSLYGSDAMAGAINIITRRGTPETRYHLLGEAGSFGHLRGVLNTSGSLEPLKYSFSLGFDRNDAQVKKDKFNLGRLGLNLDLLELKDASLRLTTHYANSAIKAFPEGSGGGRFAILRDTEERCTHEVATGLEFSHRGSAIWRQELTSGLFYRAQAVDSPGVQVRPNIFQIPPADFDTRYARYQLLWKHIFQITSNWSLVAGAQFTHEDGRREGSQNCRCWELRATCEVIFIKADSRRR